MSHAALAYLGYQANPALTCCWQAMELPAVVDAVRAALASDDPEVVRAMAERVGLEVDTDRAIPLPCGHFAGARIKRIRVSGPWREVPDAD